MHYTLYTMYSNGKIWIAQNENSIYLMPEMANRHGLIAGASGTGKTVTLKVLAESFSDMGVPVFMADIKGDVGGMCLPGKKSERIEKNVKSMGIEGFGYRGFPVCFWDIFGEKGHPVRTTVADMGPMLLSRLMGLSDIQSDVLNIIFKISEDKKWDLVDMKDLRTVVQHVGENRSEFAAEYGSLSTQSLGAVQRSLLVLEDLGGDVFFGEPELDLEDWMTVGKDGKGTINILHSVELARNPTLYSTFLIWLMTKLFDTLPEAGDCEKPKLVFFFDEAHMLFSDAPKILVQKVEQMVKLIRSKGVGIYFISQSPSDIPDQVLAQLSNRIQHALRAYTPNEQKAVRSAASSFRPNPAFKTEDAITELGIGEVLISCLDGEGRPQVVERAFVLPPESFLGAISDEDYQKIINSSEFDGKYKRKERESAAETISERNASKKDSEKESSEKKKAPAKKKTSSKSKNSTAKTVVNRAAGSAATVIGREVGRSLVRGLFGKK